MMGDGQEQSVQRLNGKKRLYWRKTLKASESGLRGRLGARPRRVGHPRDGGTSVPHRIPWKPGKQIVGDVKMPTRGP